MLLKKLNKFLQVKHLAYCKQRQKRKKERKRLLHTRYNFQQCIYTNIVKILYLVSPMGFNLYSLFIYDRSSHSGFTPRCPSTGLLPRPPCLPYANLSLSRTLTLVHELGHKCHMASILISGHFPFPTKWMTRWPTQLRVPWGVSPQCCLARPSLSGVIHFFCQPVVDWIIWGPANCSCNFLILSDPTQARDAPVLDRSSHIRCDSPTKNHRRVLCTGPVWVRQRQSELRLGHIFKALTGSDTSIGAGEKQEYSSGTHLTQEIFPLRNWNLWPLK